MTYSGGIYDDNVFGYTESVRFKDMRGQEHAYLYDGSQGRAPVVEPDTIFAVLGNQSVPVRVDAEKHPYAVVDSDGRLSQTLEFRAAPDGGILYDDQGRAVLGMTVEDLRAASFASSVDDSYRRMIAGEDNKRMAWIIGAIIAALIVIFGVSVLIATSGGNKEQPAPPPAATSVQDNVTVTVTAEPETTTITQTPEKTTVTRTETETSTVTETPERPDPTTVTETVTPSNSVQIPGLP